MALPEHISGVGTETNPFILTCWKDLYYIKDCETNGAFWKFVDNYSEDLGVTYPSGMVPEVELIFSGYGFLHGTIDFNNVMFKNGRFEGFAVYGSASSDESHLILKNMKFINFADTGNDTVSHKYRKGFIHSYQSSTYYALIDIYDSVLEIEGLSPESILFNTPYTDEAYWDERYYDEMCFHVYNSNIVLKGYEALAGNQVYFHDCIVNYDSVKLSRAMTVYGVQDKETWTTPETKIAVEQLYITTESAAYDRALGICIFYDSLITGKIVSNVPDAKSAFYHRLIRSIVDVECDTLYSPQASTPVVVNTDKCPIISYMGSYYDEDDYIRDAVGVTSEQLVDVEYLSGLGYSASRKGE